MNSQVRNTKLQSFSQSFSACCVQLGCILMIFWVHFTGEYGQRKPPYYFLLSSYWCPKKRTQSDDERLMENAGMGTSQHNYGTTDPALDAIEPVSSDIANKNVIR